jgi:predicted ABC-type ATPase
MPRPVLLVLAGANGAGKSSVGGEVLRRYRIPWFNPDEFARELRQRTGLPVPVANARAWNEGVDRLRHAIAQRNNFAFETTLGGRSIPALIAEAAATHEVRIWYCGLDGVDRHLARIAARVRAGGHDIATSLVRERYTRSRRNLVALLSSVTFLQVYDNSREAEDEIVPDPVLVLHFESGRIVVPAPGDRTALAAVPDWSKPLVEAALRLAASPPPPRTEPAPA